MDTHTKRVWRSLFALSWLVAIPVTLLAQLTPPPASPVMNVKRQADQLVALTRPGYYKALLLPDWRRPQADRQLAFSVAARLCSFANKPGQPTRSLEGERLDDRQVQLSWSRANGPVDDQVILERSFDPATDFEPIGWLPTVGSAASHGQFTDANPHPAYSYYRLRWTNAAGQPETSAPVAIRGVEVRLSVKAFPNPGTATSLQFEVAGLSETTVSVVFYDVQGRILYQNQHMVLDESGRFAFPATLVLSAGHYYARVLTNKQLTTTAFLLQP